MHFAWFPRDQEEEDLCRRREIDALSLIMDQMILLEDIAYHQDMPNPWRLLPIEEDCLEDLPEVDNINC